MFGCGAVTIGREPDVGEGEEFVGSRALAVLVDGIADAAAQGRSASEDHFADAVAVWVALHGLSTLMADNSGFPWLDRERLADALVDRLALLR
jgi:Tetracyclin repressor-like, C-terminal domain